VRPRPLIGVAGSKASLILICRTEAVQVPTYLPCTERRYLYLSPPRLRTRHVAPPHIRRKVPMASQACEWSAAASTQRMRWAARRSQQTQVKSLYRTLHAPSRHAQQKLRSLTPVCGACCPRLVLSTPPPLVPAMLAASARSRRGGVVLRVAPFVFEAFDTVRAAAPPLITNLPATLMQTPASFLNSVSDATTTAAAIAAAAPPPAVEASQVRAVADVAVDAWSVSGGTTLGARFAGVESTLFQASLLPYLVYLWFLAWTRSAPLPTSSNSSA